MRHLLTPLDFSVGELEQLFDLAAAFASYPLLSSAGAYIEAIFVVFAEPV